MRLTWPLGVALLWLSACFDPPVEAVLVDRRADMPETTQDMSRDVLREEDIPPMPECSGASCVLWVHAHPNRWARVALGGEGLVEFSELTLTAPGLVSSFVMTEAHVFALMDQGDELVLWRCERGQGECLATLQEPAPRALVASELVPSGVLALRADGAIQEIIDADPEVLLYGAEILRVPAAFAAQATAAALDRETGLAWLLLPAGEARPQDLIARVGERVTFLETATTGTTGLVSVGPDLLWTAWRQDDIQSLDATTGAPLDILLVPEIGPIAALAGSPSPATP